MEQPQLQLEKLIVTALNTQTHEPINELTKPYKDAIEPLAYTLFKTQISSTEPLPELALTLSGIDKLVQLKKNQVTINYAQAKSQNIINYEFFSNRYFEIGVMYGHLHYSNYQDSSNTGKYLLESYQSYIQCLEHSPSKELRLKIIKRTLNQGVNLPKYFNSFYSENILELHSLLMTYLNETKTRSWTTEEHIELNRNLFLLTHLAIKHEDYKNNRIVRNGLEQMFRIYKSLRELLPTQTRKFFLGKLSENYRKIEHQSGTRHFTKKRGKVIRELRNLCK